MPPYVSTMILRPVRPASAFGPPSTNPRLAATLHHHRERLGADNCAVVRADALRWLSGQTSAWDIVFVDPPFRSTLAQKSLTVLRARGLVTCGGLVYLEQSAQAANTPPGWVVEKSAQAGATSYQLLRPDTMRETPGSG